VLVLFYLFTRFIFCSRITPFIDLLDALMSYAWIDSIGLDSRLTRIRLHVPSFSCFHAQVEAALLGLPAAMGQLASLYFYGQGGLEQDPLKAFAWAQKAASSGDGPGMFRLAYCYHVGMGTPNGSNFASALRW